MAPIRSAWAFSSSSRRRSASPGGRSAWKRSSSSRSSAWQRSRICSSRWLSSSACSRAVSAASPAAWVMASARLRRSRASDLGGRGPWRRRPGGRLARRAAPPAPGRAPRPAGPRRRGRPPCARGGRRRGRCPRRGRRRAAPGAPRRRAWASSTRRSDSPMPSRRSRSEATLTFTARTSAWSDSARLHQVLEPPGGLARPLLVAGPVGLGAGGLELVRLLLAGEPGERVLHGAPLDLELADALGHPLELLAEAGQVLLLGEERQVLLPVVPVDGLERGLELEEARLQRAVALLGQREVGLEGADGVGELLRPRAGAAGRRAPRPRAGRRSPRRAGRGPRRPG